MTVWLLLLKLMYLERFKAFDTTSYDNDDDDDGDDDDSDDDTVLLPVVMGALRFVRKRMNNDSG